METQASRHISGRVVIAGLAVALFFVIGVTAILEWMPPTNGGQGGTIPSGSGPHASPTSVASNAYVGTVCGRCGVVESAHQVGLARNTADVGVAARAFGNDLTTVLAVVVSALTGNRFAEESKATSVYQVTVRFEDGSSRVLTSVGTRAWVPGDRVKVIRGRIEPDV